MSIEKNAPNIVKIINQDVSSFVKLNLVINFYLGTHLLKSTRDTLNKNMLMRSYKEYEY